ncbi:hypothetical protein [Leucobacter sp. cx-169]|uniref:hypothetical protein n=1 Tax=Leucobacter sp. cx-169 TaxID=2770549 RepID=UPI00165E9510|nr:hypothetical protein [Leucobacter sp. cx-169]MBC9927235.1 hypothetical protein [Leucobacter sp. cx-169]
MGSTCAKDFLGWSGNPVWIDEEKVRDEIDAAIGTGGDLSWTPRTVLAAAIAAVAACGWAPASWDGVTTAERVRVLLGGGRTKRDSELVEGISEHIDAAEAQVDADLADALALSSSARDGYVANLHSALAADAVTPRTFGLICSAVSYLARERQETAIRAKGEAFEPEWLGEINEKITFSGQVTTCMPVEGFAYGTTEMFVIVTTETALVKFTTAARWADDLKRGDQVTLTAKVKKHDGYNKKKQTVVTRPKPVK